ncbi:His-Xaa-Ser system radical SAM maturase HxsB [Acidovorax sp. LjRoot118]|uniref:His-Xaa-Ser system radical SAM maturase HxsB n=1 Tax=unclassified Acidovorax TaxID=2684926 RepID=UPI0009E7BA0E|nr:His-Xaa-Ser system radical SAM maturase HxsB [Acidovorax sp. Root217]
MLYTPHALTYRRRVLPDGGVVATASTGDFAVFEADEFEIFATSPAKLSLIRQAELRAKFLLGDKQPSEGMRRLMASRIAMKREVGSSGPSLHIIVPTLQCAHSCQYCQVSRSLDDQGHTMSIVDLDAACDTVLQSSAPSLTIEFQGGDPLLRFDLVKRAVLRIHAAAGSGRRIRFVVASTLHQLDGEMCDFFKANGVYLSTSIDGPQKLHNFNRPIPGRNAYERTLAGIALARERIGSDSVSALMTTTKASLAFPEDIVDEYVRQGFREIFLRPLSSYGFAKRNQQLLGYSTDDFLRFYERGLKRVIHWAEQGVEIREVYASILLNKMLSTFDAGYVDLQSPTGAGSSVLVYNYDGFVYPSDEARMLAETGDHSLRMGRIGSSLEELLNSPVRRQLIEASDVDRVEHCRDCAYNTYCAPNPVDALAQHGVLSVPAHLTEHCQRHMRLFDTAFMAVRSADEQALARMQAWAQPVVTEM